MNPVSIHKSNWFFATSCVVLVSVSAPPAAAQICCELSADPATAAQPQEVEYLTWSIAVDGATALAGAPNFDGDNPFMSDSGRVIVFNFNGSSWVEVDELTADDENDYDLFGRAVALDGDFAVIGAPRDDDGGSDSGSAYIFQRVSGSWSQVAKLTASDADVGEFFGWSVAIQGDLAVIGAIFGDSAAFDDVGAVYVFDRNFPNPDDWGQVEKLNASDGAVGDWFGRSVSIDGPVIVVGVPFADEATANQGAAYIFRFNDPNWIEEDKLTPLVSSPDDNFGESVSVAGDRAVIGAPHHQHAGLFNSGAAYVFHFDGGSSWPEEQILTPCDALADDLFGWSVSISGNVALVGAPQASGQVGNGRADVFGYLGAGWARLNQLTASDGDAGDTFGDTVSIKGGTAVVGAMAWDIIAGEGAMYGFDGLDSASGCSCPWDLNGNGNVGASDLLALIAAWGPCPPAPAACPADFDHDGSVGASDLLALLASWGPCVNEPISLRNAQDCIDKFYPSDMDALIACIEAFG